MKAFALIELLVVVAIAAILLGIVLNALSHARESSRDVACRAKLAQIRAVMYEYQVRTRHWSRTWTEIELDDSDIRFCPSVRERAYPTYSFWYMDGNDPRSFDQQVESQPDPIMVRDAFAPHFGHSNFARLGSGVGR